MGIIQRLAWRFVLLGLCLAVGLAGPGWAAERIYFDFSILGRSVAVAELENFAQTGSLTGRLGYYLNWFTSPAQQQELQAVLQARYQVDPLVVERFGYTSSGVKLLGEIGEILQTEARLNGGQAIRSAAIVAAAQPEGVSVLSFLQQFPTDLRIDLQRLVRLVQRVQSIVRDTETVVARLQQALPVAAPVAASTLNAAPADLRQLGPFSYQKRTLQILDPDRQRQFAADLYLPIRPEPDQSGPDQPGAQAGWPLGPAASTPVIVMSNGLGAGRDRFDEIALHLVSHGFAIAIPDHPGSDRQRLREFYAGQHRENFEAREYLDRPQDITVLLNQLEQLNQAELDQRLNLERVGMFGYSFGGSTALSLAGARLDPGFLKTDCQTELGLVNISLLYQCRALELPAEALGQSLKDDRIAAAFLFVPFGKSLFGPNLAQVTIPIFWQVTDLDILTPLVVEQLPAFAALNPPAPAPRVPIPAPTLAPIPAPTLAPGNRPDHYLAITQGLPHARVTYDALSRFTGSTTPWETLKQIAHDYQNALSLAFFRVYITQSQTERVYLTPAYAQAITQPPYALTLLPAADWAATGEAKNTEGQKY